MLHEMCLIRCSAFYPSAYDMLYIAHFASCLTARISGSRMLVTMYCPGLVWLTVMRTLLTVRQTAFTAIHCVV